LKEGRKYLNLGEMLEGQEAVQTYRKAIEVLTQDQNRYEMIFDVQQATLARRQSASAFACIAELMM